MAEPSTALLLPLIDDIKRAAEAASSKGPEGHAELLRSINGCLVAAETPLETIRRIGYQVRNHLTYDGFFLDSSQDLTRGVAVAKCFYPRSPGFGPVRFDSTEQSKGHKCRGVGSRGSS